ncbi:GTP cyclohydrolase FolE2 [Virgibacillus sp. SK37]|uniref:GTP cyclohydrolase FolE2 n=1 Tax=Virgibacillus sp. SK37 TaxID=403957 RepID=UPI0004D1711E|nr:GTP cyclohydrolase FolE2 [Virgibacillus sp. SK37]AIF43657.1 GTP cyclohydrolase [Virgibacillus sp. SK37]
MGNTKTFPSRKLPNKEERHKLFGSVTPVLKTKPIEKSEMADLQNTKKDFLFDLDAVGVANVKHPVTIYSNLKPLVQTSVGKIQFTSSLKNTSKGTNMSRFTEQLAYYHEKGFTADFSTLKQFVKELTERLEQSDATIEMEFPWFYERKGPQTELAGMNHANVSMRVTYDQINGFSLGASLSVFVTTLCPCSKEISEYSAHNQRGEVSIEVELDDLEFDNVDDWKQMLLEAAESNASSRLHPVLKRPDEKMVTEQAYENPRFVEDMVRLVAADLYEMELVTKFKVQCRNEESIHMHDAIASITYDKNSMTFPS